MRMNNSLPVSAALLERLSQYMPELFDGSDDSPQNCEQEQASEQEQAEKDGLLTYYKGDTEPVELKPYRNPWARLRRSTLYEFEPIFSESKSPENKIYFKGLEVLDECTLDDDSFYMAKKPLQSETAEYLNTFSDNTDMSEKKKTEAPVRLADCENLTLTLGKKMSEILFLRLKQAGEEDKFHAASAILANSPNMNTVREKIYRCYPEHEARILFDTVYSALGEYMSLPITDVEKQLDCKSFPDRLRNLFRSMADRLQRGGLCGNDISTVAALLTESKNNHELHVRLNGMYSRERASEIYDTIKKDFKIFAEIYSLIR